MITHPEPDTLECEVKRALGSITTNKASGDDGIPVELFQILKDDAVTQSASKFGKFSSGHRIGKGQFSFQSQRKAMPKNAQTTAQLHSSHMLVNAQNSPSQASAIRELPDIQAGFRKGRGTKDKIANISGSSKKQENFRKTSISALLTMSKPLTVWITINCGKF